MSSTGFVYLAVRPDGVYKIGSSIKPDARMSALRAISPGITLAHKIESANHKQIEDWLQFAFAHRRVKYEWFALEPADVEKITSVTNADSADDMPEPLQELFAANTFDLLKSVPTTAVAELPPARNPTPGTGRVEIEMTADLAAELDRFRSAYGHSMRAEIELALRRHMDSPPDSHGLTPCSPLPPPTDQQLEVVNRRRGRPKKAG